MNSSITLARLAALLMAPVAGINLYIGLYDTNLAQLSPVHSELNWIIAAADIVAVVILFSRPGSAIWKMLAGVAWPIAYVGSLFVDVETRLCLGASPTSCFPTTADAYNYLILGSASEEWVLWPYTIRLAIVLVIAVLALSLLSLALAKSKKEKALVSNPQVLS